LSGLLSPFVLSGYQISEYDGYSSRRLSRCVASGSDAKEVVDSVRRPVSRRGRVGVDDPHRSFYIRPVMEAFFTCPRSATTGPGRRRRRRRATQFHSMPTVTGRTSPRSMRGGCMSARWTCPDVSRPTALATQPSQTEGMLG